MHPIIFDTGRAIPPIRRPVESLRIAGVGVSECPSEKVGDNVRQCQISDLPGIGRGIGATTAGCEAAGISAVVATTGLPDIGIQEAKEFSIRKGHTGMIDHIHGRSAQVRDVQATAERENQA